MFVVPPNSIMAITSHEGTAIAGETFTLICSIEKKIDGLLNSPMASWIFTQEYGSHSVRNASTNRSVLTFDPLRTSHAGQYTCVGELFSLAYPMNISTQTNTNVNVQSKLVK